jgi:AraC-like DNA-binding protein
MMVRKNIRNLSFGWWHMQFEFPREPYFEEQPASGNTIQYPFHCNIQASSTGRVLAHAHWHYYIEILYMIEGRARAVLGGEGYDFCTGDMVLINGREVHAVFAESDALVRYIVLKFDPAILYTTDRTLFESKYILPFTMNVSNHQKVFPSAELAASPVPDLLPAIHREFLEKGYGFELAIRTDIGSIFLWVLRNWHHKGIQMDANPALKETDVLRLQKVFDYLDSHYKHDITVESVSSMLNMSYSYFSRYFKSLIGKTFSEYLTYVRITEAEKMLLTTDLNITEVALESGYSNSSYFIAQFRVMKGMSPRQFKKKVLSGD